MPLKQFQTGIGICRVGFTPPELIYDIWHKSTNLQSLSEAFFSLLSNACCIMHIILLGITRPRFISIKRVGPTWVSVKNQRQRASLKTLKDELDTSAFI